jgi:hypothetical protein
MRYLIPALFILVAFLSPASALGINCRGSVDCEGIPSPSVAHSLATFINGIDQERWYQNGEQIACDARVVQSQDVIRGPTTLYFCPFLQNTGGAWGSDILRLANYIPDHGCKVCGSVPYFYPSDNNVEHGELIFNHVLIPQCDKVGLF